MAQQYAPHKAVERVQTDEAASRAVRPQDHRRQMSSGPGSSVEVARQHGIEPADRIVGVEQACVGRDDAEARKAMEEHEKLYMANRETLLGAITDTGAIVSQLKDFNRERWVMHYPGTTASNNSSHPPRSEAPTQEGTDQQRPSLERSASSANSHDRPSLARSFTSPAQAKREIDTAKDMSVLRVDLKVGTATTPSALVHSLEKSAVAQLLEGRLLSSLRQLESLRQRVSDKQSKVLVTGDLNAGKSTFVNALLRRPAMPIDQQPCTTVFCEVLDAEQSNNGIEEVHVVKEGCTYDVQDRSTFAVYTLNDIDDIMMKMEDIDAQLAPVIKCYCIDTRATQESLLRNGVVDISLIDAPGLNRDSLKTTALFARQEEIDVIVFCVSAENHFTLSAKEFLLNASNDKAHVFIVVNKFDQIQNKDRCRARVLEQIRHLSPHTYEDAENLVHFVDSSAVSHEPEAASEMPTSFANLEAALCDFVLTKRNKSKLLPAQNYLLNLLIDVDFLARTNVAVANREMREAKEVLAVARPALKKVQSDARKLESQLENEEDGVVGGIVDSAKSVISTAVDTLATGKLASSEVAMPEYPGLLGLWDYAYHVRVAMLESMEKAVCQVENAARQCTSEAVVRIRSMGSERLPEDVDKPVFVSRPEAMFAKRRANRTTAAAGLGLGPEMIEVRVSDLFDAKHHIMVITGSTEDDDAKKDHEEEMSLVNSFSLGLGALTIVGGKTFGAKTAVDVLVRVSDLVGNPTVRRWALPVFIAASTGMVAWTIIDLPNSIPRNIGRSLAKELKHIGGPATQGRDQSEKARVAEQNETEASEPTAAVTALPYTFAEIQSRRVGRETRKVIRLAGYDVNERFRVAIAARKQQVAQQEDKERKANAASTYFGDTRGKVGSVRKALEGLSGWEN